METASTTDEADPKKAAIAAAIARAKAKKAAQLNSTATVAAENTATETASIAAETDPKKAAVAAAIARTKAKKAAMDAAKQQ